MPGKVVGFFRSPKFLELAFVATFFGLIYLFIAESQFYIYRDVFIYGNADWGDQPDVNYDLLNYTRLVPTLLSRLVSGLVGGGDVAAAATYFLFQGFFWATFVAFYYYLKEFSFPPVTCLLGTTVLVLLPAASTSGDPSLGIGPGNGLDYLVVLLQLYYVKKDNFRAFVVVSAVGVFVKEIAVFQFVTYFVLKWKEEGWPFWRTVKQCLPLGAIAAGYLAYRLYWTSRMPYDVFATGMFNPERFGDWFSINSLFHYAAIFGPLWLLVLPGYFYNVEKEEYGHSLLKLPAVATALVTLAFGATFALLYEVDKLFPLFPFVVPLSLVTIQELVKRFSKPSREDPETRPERPAPATEESTGRTP